MNKFSDDIKKELLDDFGKKVIDNVRDRSFNIPLRILAQKSQNKILNAKYEGLKNLSKDEIEIINTLISDTITDTIFNFLSMFEHNADSMKIYLMKEGIEYDIRDISEVVGAEIAFLDEDGWIQKFSKIDIDN